jgi:hypothetical protein
MRTYAPQESQLYFIFCARFFKEMEYHYASQAGPELLSSSGPPVLAFPVGGTAGSTTKHHYFAKELILKIKQVHKET